VFKLLLCQPGQDVLINALISISRIDELNSLMFQMAWEQGAKYPRTQ
jgi:hypothetical protein